MKTIHLRTDSKKSYYLTSITTEEKETLLLAKKNNTLKDLGILWEIDCINILKIGESQAAQPGAILDYVGYFKGYDLGEGRKLHYRNYYYTLKEQEESSHLINFCEDATLSARTALKQMTDTWCILWETLNTSPYAKF